MKKMTITLGILAALVGIPTLAEEVNTGYGAILQRTIEREALGKKVNNTRRLQSVLGLGLQNAATLEGLQEEILLLGEALEDIQYALGQDSELLLRIRQIQENQHTVEVTNNITVTQENDQDTDVDNENDLDNDTEVDQDVDNTSGSGSSSNSEGGNGGSGGDSSSSSNGGSSNSNSGAGSESNSGAGATGGDADSDARSDIDQGSHNR